MSVRKRQKNKQRIDWTGCSAVLPDNRLGPSVIQHCNMPFLPEKNVTSKTNKKFPVHKKSDRRISHSNEHHVLNALLSKRKEHRYNTRKR